MNIAAIYDVLPAHPEDIDGWDDVRQIIQNCYQMQTFDTSLPQGWYDRFTKVMGINPFGRFVWGYPEGSLFGEPLPLTQEAADWLVEFEKTL
jgi:hypothetical protein